MRLHHLIALAVFGLPALAGAATFTVTNTADAGPGSLRAALLSAPSGGGTTILFAIPGEEVHRIFPLSELPPMRGVTMDGYTQPGATRNTVAGGSTNASILIEISGDLAGNSRGLILDYGLVRGVAVNGFQQAGVAIVSGGEVTGSFVGTDASGALSRPNAEGIVITGDCTGYHSTIGGEEPADRNLISGNTGAGVRLDSANANPGCFMELWAKVQNCLLGTDAGGAAPLPNGTGIDVTKGLVEIGGGGIEGRADDGNVIAFNAGAGVTASPTGVEMLIDGLNSIHDNGGLGIDLGAPGPTPNDPLDSLQDWPVIDSAVTDGNETVITGRLSRNSYGYYDDHIIEIFLAGVCDASGFGEGRERVARVTVPYLSSGVAAWTVRVPRAVYGTLSATATQWYQWDWVVTVNTSEFSPCVPVQIIAVTPVPALDAWGTAALVAVFALIGTLRLRSRRPAAA